MGMDTICLIRFLVSGGQIVSSVLFGGSHLISFSGFIIRFRDFVFWRRHFLWLSFFVFVGVFLSKFNESTVGACNNLGRGGMTKNTTDATYHGIRVSMPRLST